MLRKMLKWKRLSWRAPSLRRIQKIAKRLEKEELTDFAASNEWLEKWKKMYLVRENKLHREANEVSTTTVQA